MRPHRGVNRHLFLQAALVLTVSAPAIIPLSAPGANEPALVLENDFTRYDIGADGRNSNFIDKRTGQDYCRRNPVTTFLISLNTLMMVRTTISTEQVKHAEDGRRTFLKLAGYLTLTARLG